MKRAVKDALNAALLEAEAKGLRPFCCWGCGDWFIQVPHKATTRAGQPRGFGRRRRVCDAPECRHARLYWLRYGRWPLEPCKGVRGDWGYSAGKHIAPAPLLFDFKDAA